MSETQYLRIGAFLPHSRVNIITEEKRQIIRESGALKFYPYTAAECIGCRSRRNGKL
jgi:hypothetical protein